MKYLDYAQHIEANQFVFRWIETTLSNYLQDNPMATTEEVEHIIDYLAQTDKKISKMSYEQAKSNSEKWLKTLMKKCQEIKEIDSDVEIILDFDDLIWQVGKAVTPENSTNLANKYVQGTIVNNPDLVSNTLGDFKVVVKEI
jgi:hypothetical protein